GAFQVDSHDRIPLGFAALRQSTQGALDPGIVTGIVEASVSCETSRDQRLYFRRLGDIRANEQGLAPGLARELSGLFSLDDPSGREDDRGAFLGKADTGRTSNARTPTCYQGNFAGHRAGHKCSPFVADSSVSTVFCRGRISRSPAGRPRAVSPNDQVQ